MQLRLFVKFNFWFDFFAFRSTCCWRPPHLHLPCNPLTGPGKRVCVESAASVDWPYFWLQAARPWSGACPQRLSLPDLRGRHQAGLHLRPFAQRGMAHTHCHLGDNSPLHFYFLDRELPVCICPDMCCSSGSIHVMHQASSNSCRLNWDFGRVAGSLLLFWDRLVVTSFFSTFCRSLPFNSQRSTSI